jgi:hypothetical protein
MAGLIERFSSMDPLSLDALLINSVEPIPDHLRRRVLKERWHHGEIVTENEWNTRGREVELYVQRVLASQTDFIDHVDINGRVDAEGPDLRVYFVEGFPIKKVEAEIKSSTLELNNAKGKTKGELFLMESDGQLRNPWAIEAVREEMRWETKTPQEKEAIVYNRIQSRGRILINGGEKDYKEKTPVEIWNSFVSQVLLAIAAQSETAA